MTSKIYSANIDSIIKAMEANEELIEYDYKDKENQILISKELVDITYSLMSDMGFEEQEFKNILKLSIKEGFELSSNDIVLSKNGNFFIKLFEKTKNHTVTEKDKNTIVNRYNGIDKEELEFFYEDFFEDKENKHFFMSVAKDFVSSYLKNGKIGNDIYEKNVYAYIHAITFENLIKIYDNSDGFFKGFAGYIFRTHFKDVFEHISDLLLEEISISNTHVIEFLKYYSQDIIVLGGKKYVVPSLEAKDSLRWNVGSILSITKIYTKSKKAIKSLQIQSSQANATIKKLYIGNLSPVEYRTVEIQKRQSFDNDITYLSKKIDRYLDILSTLKNEDQKHAIKKEIHTMREEITQLKEGKETLSETAIDPNKIREYSKLQSEIDSLTRQLKREKIVLFQNRESYSSIRESLVKALMSKKKLL